MKNIVYKISNSINNKLYFGVTQQDLKIRWQQHKCNSNKKNYYLYNAMKKYGFNNFKIEIVFEANTKEEMIEKEMELINLYKTNNRLYGYNNSTGGESSRKGCKLTQDTKDKISESQKNRERKPHSKETKEKMSLSAKGRNMDLAQKKSALLRKGKPAHNCKKIILNNEIIFNSMTEASKELKICVSTISNNIIGLSKKTKLGIWKIYE